MWKFAIITLFYIIWALIAAEEVDILKTHAKTGCNSTILANSSGFDLDKHNLNKTGYCFWNITPKTPGPITLFFSSVLLHDKDELNIYKNKEDADNHTNPLTKEPIRTHNGSLTIITNENTVFLALTGNSTSYARTLEGYYVAGACYIPVSNVEIFHAPVYLEEVTEQKECSFRFNEILAKRSIKVFSFEEFNMSSSEVKVEGGTFDGTYTNSPPTDFFIKDTLLTVTVRQALNSSDNFKLKIHEVDKACSGAINSEEHHQLISPSYVVNNGSIETIECRWLVSSPKKDSILGLKFDTLDFQNVLDIAAVNDGLSEFSQPLLQVTTSNKNSSLSQMIRASGNSLWVSFKPVSYKSSFIANITTHGQGGYFKNNGDLKMGFTTGNDTVFLLEVDDNKVIELNTELSTFSPPATLSVYDGFDMSNLLTSVHGQIKYPILSRSSRMMIIGTNFSVRGSEFKASFQGIVPGCNHMSSLETENYILSENCNSTCHWIIPPQDSPNSALVVNLQYLSLQKSDVIKIQKLDDKLTEIGEFNGTVTHVPHFTIPASVGALISITQAACKEKKDKIVLIGHSSYVPGCSQNISPVSSEILQISSPLYPDTYPVYANCLWNVSAPKGAIVHMAFQSFSLSENHCVKVSQKSGEMQKYEGTTIPPDDLFLSGDALIEFDSSGCNKSEVGKSLESSLGFLLNVTVTGCGTVLKNKSGEFSTSIIGNNTICIWKVTVSATNNDGSVNILSYSVSTNDSSEISKLHVYDGATVREPEILNVTRSGIWSRTNTLIFVYERSNVSERSPVLTIKYNTISCNQTMQCANKICMHPDWRCNNINDCGDFSDEQYCGSVPVPPTNPPSVEYTGYSATAFWLCLIAMLIIGVISGLTVPVCYQKYKDSRYRRFHELDG